jgi:ATP-dependent Clp protease ATP-binding subunit ClpA
MTQHSSIFHQFGKVLSKDTLKDRTFPLKDHLQIPYIIDTLSRKEQHHILLHGNISEKIHFALLESIALHIANGHIPKKLQEATVIYFDAKRFSLSCLTNDDIEHELQTFCNQLDPNKLLIFAINDIEILSYQFLRKKLTDSQWRLMVLTSSIPTHLKKIENFFSLLRPHEPNEKELLALLKTYRDNIENFHNIIMPDEIFHYALSLSEHYLGGKYHLDKAIELLDSGAARASTLERNEQNSQTFKPILTTTILAHVVSNWTQIPLSHLHHNKFKLSKFLQSIQQKIFGQDNAISAIGTLLQTTCIKHQENTGPVCNLLLVGPAGVGKNELAFAVTEYLFSSSEALLQVILNKHNPPQSLADISVIIESTTTERMSLLEAIRSKPYAVVLLENLHEMPTYVMDLFKDLMIHGHTFDEQGNAYDMRHAIVIITTTLGAENIISLTNKQAALGATPIMDLMQLVLNENANQFNAHSHLSTQDVHEHVLPELLKKFPAEILRYSHIIPFLPIDQTALEKIIKYKLSHLIKSLNDEFGIELTYAAEIIKFLAYETLKKNENAQPLHSLFEQHIYTTVANEILTRIDDKNRPKRLALLLNDAGTLLRCEFVSTTEGSLYTM